MVKSNWLLLLILPVFISCQKQEQVTDVEESSQQLHSTDMAKPPADDILIFHSKMEKQCEPNSGDDIELHLAKLQSLDVETKCHKVGSNGRMYMSMCGGPNDKIHIFKIAAAQLAIAEQHGFKAVSVLGEYGTSLTCS